MLRKMKAGSTSQSIPLFIADTTSAVGAGLGSIVFNTSGLAAKYRRQGDSSWTTITLATMTLGTWATGGFVTDGGSVTGGYEFGIPNAVVAAGVEWVEIEIYGATNMLAVLIFIELDAVNYQSATGFVSSVPAVVGAVGSVSGAVGSVTARVTANTDQLAGQTVTAAAGVTVPSSIASPTNITAGTITTVTNLTNAPSAGDFTSTMKTSLNAATPAVTVSDKTGFSLSSAGVQAIWDALTSALTTAGSIGKRLVDFITTLVYVAPTTPPTVTAIRQEMDSNSTKLAHLQADLTATPPTAAAIATAVLAAAVESGVSVQQILEAIGAATAGDYDNATGTFRAVGNHATTRLTTVLANSNRTNTPTL